METFFLTDQGKVRSHNEDSGGVFRSDHSTLMIVADGMGGHQAGDVASHMAVTLIKEMWDEHDLDLDHPEQVEVWLTNTVKQVNEAIFQYAKDHPECHGMGTTIVIAISTPEFVTIGHIGDSRCYLYKHHELKQLTHDHSLVNELVKSGQITKEAAELHPRKNVLMRALGTEQDVDLDVRTMEWEGSEILLLCSDGLTNKIPDQELKALLADETSVEDKAKQMVGWANERGGEDNISVAIVQLKGTGSE